MGVLAEVSGDSWKAGWEVQEESSPGLLATGPVLSTIPETPTFLPLGMPWSVRSNGFDRALLCIWLQLPSYGFATQSPPSGETLPIYGFSLIPTVSTNPVMIQVSEVIA